ncbi:prephenate dehydrogenase [Blattabacterium cuenoti]|uniref:prephenate dehydrogenase n=1 Tax=Blattabacterium cuenoti TaxID=1653831 RepID=UPI00163CC183|nr:prephenate dehydrogenase [Blattabacterium cuenoti]
MNIGIIGLGLIGGSMGLNLRKSNFAHSVFGMDANPTNASHAVKLGIVDKILPLEDLLLESNIIILSIPVDAIQKILPNILNKISNSSVVLDTGSTKQDLCKSILHHPQRRRFVATHPIAGIEHSGPMFADSDLFLKKNCIICDAQFSDGEALSLVKQIYSTMKMRIIHTTSEEHDLYISYISHLPHVLSFSLARTILKKFFKKEKIVNTMMGSGLYSTIRLAKSNPKTWLPIFASNRNNMIQAINGYIHVLEEFRYYLLNKKFHEIFHYLKKANSIKDKKYV